MVARIYPIVLILLVGLAGGCGTSAPRFRSSAPVKTAEVAGVADPSSHQLAGIASYYADEFHRRKTANGESYDMHDLTAAHRTLPFNSKVRVTNLENGKSVVVRINDRGPFKDNRVIDLSLEAAKRIDLIVNGTANVQLEVHESGNESLVPPQD